jgi:hypothetical protein
MQRESAESSEDRWLLLAAWLFPPSLWLLQLPLMYALVPFACEKQRPYLLYFTTVAAMLLVGVCGVFALRRWRHFSERRMTAAAPTPDANLEATPDPGATGLAYARNRFLAAVAALMSVQIALILVAQAFALIIFSQCQ